MMNFIDLTGLNLARRARPNPPTPPNRPGLYSRTKQTVGRLLSVLYCRRVPSGAARRAVEKAHLALKPETGNLKSKFVPLVVMCVLGALFGVCLAVQF